MGVLETGRLCLCMFSWSIFGCKRYNFSLRIVVWCDTALPNSLPSLCCWYRNVPFFDFGRRPGSWSMLRVHGCWSGGGLPSFFLILIDVMCGRRAMMYSCSGV